MSSSSLDPVGTTEARLLARVWDWSAQAVEPIDAAAIARRAAAGDDRELGLRGRLRGMIVAGPATAVTTQRQERRRPVLSATRLVAATAIVALGAGALFLTASQGPTPAPTIVPVSPSPRPSQGAATPIVVARDGSGDFATIAEAVAAAQDGDTVLVRPGRYPESIRIEKDISLTGDGDRSAVVIAPEGVERSPSNANGGISVRLEGSNATVSNLTVRSREDGEAVVVSGGAPVIEDVAIDVPGDYGTSQADDDLGPVPSVTFPHVGLRFDQESRAVARRISLTGGWLVVEEGSTPTVESSHLTDACVLIRGAGTSPVLRDSTIGPCPARPAIAIVDGASPLITTSDITGAFDGGFMGGIDVRGGESHPVIRGNRIHDGSGWGIGVAKGAAAAIEDNEIDGWTDTGIGTDEAGHPRITGNRIHHNGTGIGDHSPKNQATVIDRNSITSNGVGAVVRGGFGQTVLTGNTATTEVVGNVQRTRGGSCNPTWTFSDPRLQGTVTWASNEDTYLDGSGLGIVSVAIRIENADGAWRQIPILTAEAPQGIEYDGTHQFFLIGEGTYEGLIAVGDGFQSSQMHGFIIEGELPAPPETAATQ